MSPDRCRPQPWRVRAEAAPGVSELLKKTRWRCVVSPGRDRPSGRLTYPGNVVTMADASTNRGLRVEPVESKITSQGQVSIPAPIRSKLGLAPGSTVQWCLQGGQVIVRRATRHTSRDIHDALFTTPPEPRTVEEMKEGIRRHLREKHARR